MADEMKEMMEERKKRFQLKAQTEEVFRREKVEGFDPGKVQSVVCRLFGIVRVAEAVQNTVLLIHGPKGCANYMQMEAFIMNRKIRPYISTNVKESDVILGTEDVLRRAIREAADIYKPDLILVTTTCATEIIAEDFAHIVEEMTDEVDCKLCFKPGGGIYGAYDLGYLNGYEVFIDDVMEAPTKRRKGYVNLIGDLRPPGSDTWELVRMIEGIGLKFHVNIVSGSTIEQIRRSQEAEVNITKCNPSARKTCELIQAKFGTPFLAPTNPVSIGAASDWLMELARFFGKEHEAEEFIKKETAELQPIIDRVKRKVGGKKVAVGSMGPGKTDALTRLVLELGMEPMFCYSHTYSADTDRFLNQVCDMYGVHPRIEWEYPLGFILRDSLYREDFDLFLGGGGILGQMYYRGIPVKNIMVYAHPFYGFKGAKKFALEVEGQLDSPLTRLGASARRDEYKSWRETGLGGF